MASLAEEQLSEQFQHDSCAFLEWFTAAKGTRMSPKLELADLRASAAGRGVGKISYRCTFPPYTDTILAKLPKPTSLKTKNSLPFPAPSSSTRPTQTYKSG
jgi:hypothetical protein